MSTRASRRKRQADAHLPADPSSEPALTVPSPPAPPSEVSPPLVAPRRRGRQPKVAQATPSAIDKPSAVSTASADDSAGRKRALSQSGAQTAGTAKRTKPATPKESTGVEDALSNIASGVSVGPPKHARKLHAPVLLDGDFNTSGDESVDVPLLNTTGVQERAIEDALSDMESLDGEELDQMADALAEQSESEDELLTGLLKDEAALAAQLAAEAPSWTTSAMPAPKPTRASTSDKGKARAWPESGSSPPQQPASIPATPIHLARPALDGNNEALIRKVASSRSSVKNSTGLAKAEARLQIERPVFKTPAIAAVPSIATTSTLVSSTITAPSLVGPTIRSPANPPAGLPVGQITSTNPTPGAGLNANGADDEDSDDDAGHAPVIPAAAYQIIFPAQGGPLSLKAQHLDVQDVIRTARRRLERDIVLRDAFPDARNRGRFVRMAMVETVKTLRPAHRYAQLTVRMVTDNEFTRALSSIPNQRISTFRGKVKEKSDIAVAAAYGLTPGKAQERVEWLLGELIYVYPTDFEKKSIAEGKPYQHPIVISVLREAFFKGHRSFASKNTDVFTSSLPQRPEKEIPMVMLALVGAAIHGSLLDWKSGDFAGASSFSADKYVDAYNEHMIFMKGIKSSSATKYHTMMYKLYNAASGAILVSEANANSTGSTALTRLKLAAMEED